MFKKIKAWHDNMIEAVQLGIFGTPLTISSRGDNRPAPQWMESDNHTMTDTGLRHSSYLNS